MKDRKDSKGDFRFKSKAGETVKKSPKVRKSSVRRLPDFAAIRQEFERFAMPDDASIGGDDKNDSGDKDNGQE